MGRRKKDVWIHFKQIRTDGIIRAKCDPYADTVVANPERMVKHWKLRITASSADPEFLTAEKN